MNIAEELKQRQLDRLLTDREISATTYLRALFFDGKTAAEAIGALEAVKFSPSVVLQHSGGEK